MSRFRSFCRALSPAHFCSQQIIPQSRTPENGGTGRRSDIITVRGHGIPPEPEGKMFGKRDAREEEAEALLAEIDTSAAEIAAEIASAEAEQRKAAAVKARADRELMYAVFSGTEPDPADTGASEKAAADAERAAGTLRELIPVAAALAGKRAETERYLRACRGGAGEKKKRAEEVLAAAEGFLGRNRAEEETVLPAAQSADAPVPDTDAAETRTSGKKKRRSGSDRKMRGRG